MEKKVYFNSVDGIMLCGILHTPENNPRGNILMAHGISVDKDEDGLFTETARKICENEYNVFRFDFRGHGESEGNQEDMIIVGELLDIDAAFKYLKKYQDLPMGMLIASFGAASGVIYVANNPLIKCVVLWNPVLDLVKTFLEPMLPWAKGSFNEKGYQHLEETGYLFLDVSFKIGIHLIWEMRLIKPYEYMKMIKCPVVTLHGDKDTYVPYEVSKRYYKCNLKSEFISISGSEHGFGKKEDQQIVINKSIEWFDRYNH